MIIPDRFAGRTVRRGQREPLWEERLQNSSAVVRDRLRVLARGTALPPLTTPFAPSLSLSPPTNSF